LIAVGGLSGTGKSLLARALAADIAPDPGAVVLRSDVERKTAFGLRETERLPPAAYAPEVTAGIYATLARKAARVLAAGHSVVVDAVFGRADERDAVRSIAQRTSVPFHGLFLTADLATRLSRVAGRQHDASDADADIVRQQERYDLRTLDWTEVDASGTPDDTLARAKASLS
jgi:predicted kinase